MDRKSSQTQQDRLQDPKWWGNFQTQTSYEMHILNKYAT
jgi:hypothetical protein